MKVIFDTSSFLSLVRYYLPFDHNDVLLKHLHDQFSSGNILLTEGILQECRRTSKRIIPAKLPTLFDKDFLKSCRCPCKTSDIVPPKPKSFFNMLNNQFCVQTLKKKLSDDEFEIQKQIFFKSADMSMILLALNKKEEEQHTIVTEETDSPNDNKLFKKIPIICQPLGVHTQSLTEYFASQKEIFLSISKP